MKLTTTNVAENKVFANDDLRQLVFTFVFDTDRWKKKKNQVLDELKQVFCKGLSVIVINPPSFLPIIYNCFEWKNTEVGLCLNKRSYWGFGSPKDPVRIYKRRGKIQSRTVVDFEVDFKFPVDLENEDIWIREEIFMKFFVKKENRYFIEDHRLLFGGADARWLQRIYERRPQNMEFANFFENALCEFLGCNCP